MVFDTDGFILDENSVFGAKCAYRKLITNGNCKAVICNNSPAVSLALMEVNIDNIVSLVFPVERDRICSGFPQR